MAHMGNRHLWLQDFEGLVELFGIKCTVKAADSLDVNIEGRSQDLGLNMQEVSCNPLH